MLKFTDVFDFQLEENILWLNSLVQNIENKVESMEKKSLLTDKKRKKVKNARKVISHLKYLIKYLIYVRVNQKTAEELILFETAKEFAIEVDFESKKRIHAIRADRKQNVGKIDEYLNAVPRLQEELKMYLSEKKNIIITWTEEEQEVLKNFLKNFSNRAVSDFCQNDLPYILKSEKFYSLLSPKLDEKTKNCFDTVRSIYQKNQQIVPVETLGLFIRHQLEDYFCERKLDEKVQISISVTISEYQENIFKSIDLSKKTIDYIRTHSNLTSNTLPSKECLMKEKYTIEKESKRKIRQIKENVTNQLSATNLRVVILKEYGITDDIALYETCILGTMISDWNKAYELLSMYQRVYLNYLIEINSVSKALYDCKYVYNYWYTYVSKEMEYESKRQKYWMNNIAPFERKLREIKTLMCLKRSKQKQNSDQFIGFDKSIESLECYEEFLKNEFQKLIDYMKRYGINSSIFSSSYEFKIQRIAECKRREMLKIFGSSILLKNNILDSTFILTPEQLERNINEYIEKMKKEKFVSIVSKSLYEIFKQNESFFTFISCYLKFDLYRCIPTPEVLRSISNLCALLTQQTQVSVPQFEDIYYDIIKENFIINSAEKLLKRI